MTLSEISDSFKLQYKFESVKRNIPYVELAEKHIALYISEAQQDLASRLKIIETYSDITLSTGTYEYSLPANFGSLIRIEDLSGVHLEIVSINDIASLGTIAVGTPSRASVYYNGTAYKLRVDTAPAGSEALRVWYNADTFIYSASGGQAQSWGAFDGMNYSGNLKIPARYEKAVILYLLQKAMSPLDNNYFAGEYLQEIYRLKSMTGSSVNYNPKYKMGGIS